MLEKIRCKLDVRKNQMQIRCWKKLDANQMLEKLDVNFTSKISCQRCKLDVRKNQMLILDVRKIRC